MYHLLIDRLDPSPRATVPSAATLFLLGSLLCSGALASNEPQEVERVSVGNRIQGIGFTFQPALSPNGRLLAFSSNVSTFVPGDTNGEYDVFVRDLQTGEVTLVSVNSAGDEGNDRSDSPVFSANGRLVGFRSFADNLVPADTNREADLFVHDLKTGQTRRVSVSNDGAQGNGSSGNPAFSSNGRFMAFDSAASTLAPGDANGTFDVFVRDMKSGAMILASVSSDGSLANNHCFVPTLSANGGTVVFQSLADNLVPGDTNQSSDVFVRDLKSGQTRRVSVDSDGGQGNSHSDFAEISSNGRLVIFQSVSSNLVPGDTNGERDVFVHDLKTGQTRLISVSSDGSPGDSSSADATFSRNGRAVAFSSFASTLVPGDTNNQQDVFLHHLKSGQTIRISVNTDGSQADKSSAAPTISSNGKVVAFESTATNLVPGDTNGGQDVFVRDLSGKGARTTRESVSGPETQGDDVSNFVALSANGRLVGFDSRASNIVPNDTNGLGDVFVRDRKTGQTRRVSVNSEGVQGNSSSLGASISSNGGVVAFRSFASNLVPGDSNGVNDVFVHDLKNGLTTRISVSTDGTQGNDNSYYPAISSNGRFVAFSSESNNLVPGDTNGLSDIFVHDRKTGQTRRVSVDSDGVQADGYSYDPTISSNGRIVAFTSDSNNLAPGDSGSQQHVFVHDLKTGQTTRVSKDSDGALGNSSSSYPGLSQNGRFVVFRSSASNLVSDDTNGVSDIFVHDRKSGRTRRASVGSDGTQANEHCLYPALSPNGRKVAFSSKANNIVTGDANGNADVFVHDMKTGATSLVSVNAVGFPGDSISFWPTLSATGRVVAFISSASNLVPDDTNGKADVFVRDLK